MSLEFKKFSELTINYDKERIPLSSSERESKQGEYPYYGAQGIIDYVDEYIFDGEYLLIAEDGENLNSRSQPIAQVVNGKFWVNNHAHIIKTNETCDIHYLCYLLNNTNISGYVTGSAQPKLNQSNLNSMVLEIQDYRTQCQISKIIKLFNKKIEICNSITNNLEEQLSLIFNDWFIDCNPFQNEHMVKTEWGDIPETWKNIEFGELIEITSGDRPDEKSDDKTLEFNIPLFGASKIMGYTKKASYNEDILIIGRVGTHGVIQRVNYPCFPSDNTFVIKSNYYGFVYQLLKRIDYDSLNTGSTQPLITQKSLKSINVVLPDEEILSKFERLSKIIFNKIQLNNDEIANLAKLRDTLVPKLMSGEIDVTNIKYVL